MKRYVPESRKKKTTKQEERSRVCGLSDTQAAAEERKSQNHKEIVLATCWPSPQVFSHTVMVFQNVQK